MEESRLVCYSVRIDLPGTSAFFFVPLLSCNDASAVFVTGVVAISGGIAVSLAAVVGYIC